MRRLLNRWRSRPLGYVPLTRWYGDETALRIAETLDWS